LGKAWWQNHIFAETREGGKPKQGMPLRVSKGLSRREVPSSSTPEGLKEKEWQNKLRQVRLEERGGKGETLKKF